MVGQKFMLVADAADGGYRLANYDGSAIGKPYDPPARTLAEDDLGLRDWETRVLSGGVILHSRVLHQRGELGGYARLPDLDESLDEWFDRLSGRALEQGGLADPDKVTDTDETDERD